MVPAENKDEAGDINDIFESIFLCEETVLEKRYSNYLIE